MRERGYMEEKERVLVWDIAIRLFHFLLVLLITFSVWTGIQGGIYLEYHFLSGYCILCLVVFRVLWGVLGSTTAQFKSFVKTPRTVAKFLLEIVRGTAPSFTGHNPAGGYMVITLLITIFCQTITGLFSDDQIFNAGPLRSFIHADTAGMLTNWHHITFDVLVVLSAIHVFAIFWHEWILGERLIISMITGKKEKGKGSERIIFVSHSRLLIALTISIVIVWGLVNY